MVQSILLFTLGFLVASLLALLTAPLLWRRAQTIMRRRLEAIVPMSLDDVRADRDALRAEHAMTMRKLEIENAEVRRIDAEHVIEIGRGREELKERADTIARRNARIDALEQREDLLTDQLRKREKELSALEVSARTASREIARQRERAESVSNSLRSAERDASERAETIASLERELADMRSRLADANAESDRVWREMTERGIRGEPDASENAEPDAETLAKLESAEKRVAELEQELADTDNELRPRLLALGQQLSDVLERIENETDQDAVAQRVAELVEKPATRSAVANDHSEATGDTDIDELSREFDVAAESELGVEEPDRKVG